MSADNGIYILKTPFEHSDGFEYRVIHTQAIENIYWNPKTHEESNDATEVVVDYFGEARVMTEDEVQKEAFRLANEVGHTEYGIQTITLPNPFSHYILKKKV